MTYNEHLTALFEMLYDANMADSELAEPWQRPEDCRDFSADTTTYYGNIRRAIIAIAGERIINYWAETGEVDLTLADRLFEFNR